MIRNPRFRSVAERDLDQWALWLGLLAAMLVLTLSSCTGTSLTTKGQLCGQPFELTMVDRKDRAGFTAKAECPGGGGIEVMTSESSTSSVIQAQAELATRLTALAELLARSVPGPVNLEQPELRYQTVEVEDGQ